MSADKLFNEIKPGVVGRALAQICETGHTVRRGALQWKGVADSHCVRQRAR